MQMIQPLRGRPIGLVWTGQLLSATGSEFYMVAVIWIATSMVGNDAGYVSALQAGALLAGSLFGGLVTDRWRHRTTMVAMNIVRAGLLLGLSIAGSLGVMNLPLLAVTAALVALATSAFDPALQATLPSLAPDPALRHATNGLFDATKRMARIIGPSLIAVASALMSVIQFFTVTAISFALAAGCVVAGLRGVDLPHYGGPAKGLASLVEALTGGVRAVRGRPVMIFGLAGILVSNAAWAIGILLGMVLHMRATSAAPLIDYSLMMSAYGVGNLGANLWLTRRPPRNPAAWLILSKLSFGGGIALLPLVSGHAAVMAVACVAAVNGPLENLAMLHLIQTDVQPRRLSQVFRLLMTNGFTGLLAAYLLAPTLFDVAGVVPTIVATGLATIGVGLLGWPLAFGRPRATPV